MTHPLNTTARVIDGRAFSGGVFNPYGVRVWLNTAQAGIANSTLQKVNFDKVDWDRTNSWDPVNFRWTVPIYGYYVVYSVVNLVIPADNNAFIKWQIGIYKQGLAIAAQSPYRLFTQPNPAALQNTGETVSDVVQLNANDTLEVDAVVISSGGGNFSINNGQAGTFLSIYKLPEQ